MAAGPSKSVELGRCSRLALHACRQPSKRGVCKRLYRNPPRSIPLQSRRKHHWGAAGAKGGAGGGFGKVAGNRDVRLEEFALSLHPDKTRLIEFGRHAAANRETKGLGKPETFNFLGFTFLCGKSRRGNFLLKRKTRRDRAVAKLKEVKDELRRRMHLPIPWQGMWLRQVVTGFYGYHAVPTNFSALAAFRIHVARLWRRALRRRSQKDGSTWARIEKLAHDFLPQPRILHPWPSERFAVKHPRWEPYAGKPHVRICAGGAQ